MSDTDNCWRVPGLSEKQRAAVVAPRRQSEFVNNSRHSGKPFDSLRDLLKTVSQENEGLTGKPCH